MNPQTQTFNSGYAYKKHHFWRSFFGAIFGIAALLLIFISLLAVWFTHTITNTNTYVETVAPLAQDKDIQTYVANQTAQKITDSLPLQDSAHKLLPGADASQAASALKQLIQPIVIQSVRQVVQSPQFATIWRDTNASVHAQFIAQLDSNQPNNQLTLDLTPVFNGVVAELKTTQLASVVNNITISPSASFIHIKSDNVAQIRRWYHNLKFYTTLTVLAAVLCALLAITFAVHHAKVFRRLLLLSGVGLLIFTAALYAAGRYTFTGSDAVTQNALISFSRILLHNLQMGSFGIGIIFIATAFLYLWVEHLNRAKRSHSLDYARATENTAGTNVSTPQPSTPMNTSSSANTVTSKRTSGKQTTGNKTSPLARANKSTARKAPKSTASPAKSSKTTGKK